MKDETKLQHLIKRLPLKPIDAPVSKGGVVGDAEPKRLSGTKLKQLMARGGRYIAGPFPIKPPKLPRENPHRSRRTRGKR